MLQQVSEKIMHRVRWILTISWLIIIVSLLYDPWTVALTKADHPWSPLRINSQCIHFQGGCLTQQPYPLGATIFWGMIVPSGIFILLVFGHELWRRICPLSFLSQIPRALGWQRQFKRKNPQTGKVFYELAKVKSDSWLGKNYAYVQFAWLFVGLCGRILFFNSDRLILFSWLIFTIAAAITVGYLYGGKSWCNYFCPMAAVQRIYSEPSGLLASKAHMSDQLITQSMCRVVLPDGKEQSACVACQNPCIDIDAERSYWENLNKPSEIFIRYAYLGLVVGYFVYYYLYAGSWDYYFSGIWAQQSNQLSSLFTPGFYIFGKTIHVPKLLAVPMTLGAFTFCGLRLGKWLEKCFKGFKMSQDILRHRIFTVCTFSSFNFFFIFARRPLIVLLPLWTQHIYNLGLVALSTLWLYKTWQRTPRLYAKENLRNRLYRRLEELQLDISPFLEGRSLSELNIHEIYILAKTLPSFSLAEKPKES